MRNTKLNGLVVVFSLLLSSFLYAQSPDLEITSASRGTGNGPTLDSGAFTFLKNTDNPTGTTYAAYTPALTATYTISNPQYTGTNGTFGTSPRSPLVYGVSLGSNATIISNFIGTPLDNFFTASGATTGTGIIGSTAATSNRGVRIYCSSYPLRENAVPTNSTPYMGDITITFNRPVNNPILHISGSGGGSGTQAFFGEFELKSINGSASPPASGTLTRLSGSTPLYVSGNYIGNSSDGNYTQLPTTGGANDGSGSVQVNGTGITTLTFKYYLKGAPFDGTAQWASATPGTGAGEALTLSVSTLESDLAITQSASTLAPDYCNNMTFTVNAANNGASNSPNTIVNALLPSGYTYVTSVASTGTYDNTTGVWTIGTLNDAATATLTITAKAKTTGTYAFTSTISGDNIDPVTTNNTSTITPVPIAFIDSDGDGITNDCDQDDDNDGILDTDECGSTNRVANGTFPTSGNNTNTVPGWTVGGTYSAVWPSNIGRVNLNVNGLEFRRDEATTTTLSQNLTGVTSGAVLSLNQMYWFRTAGTEANNSFTLTISYAGVTYATITSTGAPAPSIQSFNGASVNISSLPAIGSQVNVSSKVDVVITLPYTLLPATGTLLFNFAAGVAATQVRDLGMQSVSLISCKDTDNDLIPDYLDLDSDNDGCPDAIEGAGTIAYSQLNSNNQISGSVDSNGVPTAASGGQAVGSSADSSVKAPECSTCNIGNPAFIDSDGDGFGNDCDQDDDNDGILDVNEARTLGTANGTDTQYVNVETTAFNASLGGCTNVNFKINDATNQIGTYKSYTQSQIDFSAIVTQDLGVATTVPIVGAFSTSSPNNTTLGDITYLVTPGKFEQFNVYIADPENTSFDIRAYDAANNQLQAVDWSVATFSRTTPSSPSSFLAMPIINSNNVTYSPTINQSQMPDDAFRVRFGEATMKNAVKIVISINRNNTASTNADEIEYFVSGICLGDTDGDGTPDKFDLDSDNDGCLDAIEGGADITSSQLVNSAGTVSVGTGSTASNQNLCASATCVNTSGLPLLSPAPTGYNNNTGQSIGTSQNPLVNTCFCYETPTNLTASVPVKHGITVLGRAGSDNGNWPMIRNSAYTALEGKAKGFVVTRNSSPETTIANPVVGMMVFDTNEGATGCLKIYTGSAVGEGWKCFSTQGCP